MESGCYTGMAALYDTLMQDVDYDRWTDSLVRLIERYGDVVHDDRIRIIDCACGTGAITVRLAERGMELTGLDCSEDMLRFASEKRCGQDCGSRLCIWICARSRYTAERMRSSAAVTA